MNIQKRFKRDLIYLQILRFLITYIMFGTAFSTYFAFLKSSPKVIWGNAVLIIYAKVILLSKNAWYGALIINSFLILILIIRLFSGREQPYFDLVFTSAIVALLLKTKPFFFKNKK